MTTQKMQQRSTIGPAEAAVIIGVSRDTVRRWAKAGRIRHVLVPSGRMRFYTEDIEALLEPVEVDGDPCPFGDPLPGLESEAVAV